MQVVFSTEITCRVTVNSKRLHSYRLCGVRHSLVTRAREREKLEAFPRETLGFLEKTGTVVSNGRSVCGGFTGQMSSGGLSEARLQRRRSEGGDGGFFFAIGVGSLRSSVRKDLSGGGTACAAGQGEEPRNSRVRIEWRLCGALRATEKRQGRMIKELVCPSGGLGFTLG